MVGGDLLAVLARSEIGGSVGVAIDGGRLVSVGIGVLITRCWATDHRFGRSACLSHATKMRHAKKPRNNINDDEFRADVESSV